MAGRVPGVSNATATELLCKIHSEIHETYHSRRSTMSARVRDLVLGWLYFVLPLLLGGFAVHRAASQERWVLGVAAFLALVASYCALFKKPGPNDAHPPWRIVYFGLATTWLGVAGEYFRFQTAAPNQAWGLRIFLAILLPALGFKILTKPRPRRADLGILKRPG